MRRSLVTLLALATVLGGLNMLCLLLAGWTRIAAQPVDIQTESLLRLRLGGTPPSGTRDRVVFLGDSVTFGQSLKKFAPADWPDKTLPARFGARLTGRRHGTLNLGINGVLFTDLACVAAHVLRTDPAYLVINVSMRPFASEFTDGPGSLSRPFLCPPENTPTLDRIERALRDHALWQVPLFRYRDDLQFLLLNKPPTQWLTDAVTARLRRDANEARGDEEVQEEHRMLEEMLQRAKVANRYNSITVSPDGVQGRALRDMVQLLKEARRPRTLFFYLEEDLAGYDQIDRERYRTQFDAFERLLRTLIEPSPDIDFIVIRHQALAGQYDDHVHLTPAGYDRLAAMLLDELQARFGSDAPR